MSISSLFINRTPRGAGVREHRAAASEQVTEPLSAEELLTIADRVARNGLSANESELRRVADQGRTSGVSRGAVDTLADPRIAEAMRARAFSRVLSQLI